jgi:hypothetical protein
MDRKPWNQVLLLTADRGNITARSSAAMRARSGNWVAAGDGLSAFGAALFYQYRSTNNAIQAGFRNASPREVVPNRAAAQDETLAPILSDYGRNGHVVTHTKSNAVPII